MARVLVVDDEPAIRRVIARALTAEGHVVRTAGDGGEALALLEVAPADVVLTDLRMPGLDGVELGARLARDFAGTRVIVMSGSLDRGGTGAIRVPATAAAFLRKPFSLDEVVESVRRVSATP
jgi:CheY-like chemotaxis protein